MTTPDLDIYFVDVGQGDMIVAVPPNGNALLVDCPSHAVEVGLSFLKSKGIRRLGLVAISHSDDDHAGGIVDLLESFQGEVGYLTYLPDRNPLRHTTSYRELLRDLYNLQMAGRVRGVMPSLLGSFPTDGYFGNMALEILHPDLGAYTANANGTLTQNSTSLLMRMTYAGKRILLGADMQRPGWQIVINRGVDLRAEVLKYPHHGAHEEVIPDVLAAVDPEWVFLSVGTGNSHGHPRSGTFDSLMARKTKFMCTQATERCLQNILQEQGKILAAHGVSPLVGLGVTQRVGCPCAGTIRLQISDQGISVEPESTKHDEVKDILTAAQCRRKAVS